MNSSEKCSYDKESGIASYNLNGIEFTDELALSEEPDKASMHSPLTKWKNAGYGSMLQYFVGQNTFFGYTVPSKAVSTGIVGSYIYSFSNMTDLTEYATNCLNKYHLSLNDINEYIAERIDSELAAGTITAEKAQAIKESVSTLLSNIILIGDVNNDGELDIDDVTLIQKNLAEFNDNINPDDFDFISIADYNEDGFVDIDDATAIQKILAYFN